MMIYQIDDKPWTIINGEPQQVRILALNIVCSAGQVEEKYVCRYGTLHTLNLYANELFPTKEELLIYAKNLH